MITNPFNEISNSEHNPMRKSGHPTGRAYIHIHLWGERTRLSLGERRPRWIRETVDYKLSASAFCGLVAVDYFCQNVVTFEIADLTYSSRAWPGTGSRVGQLRATQHNRSYGGGVEGPKERAQCHCCQQFGHSSHSYRPMRCVKCGGEHVPDECDRPREDKSICANCTGPHTNNDRRCPVLRQEACMKSLKIPPQSSQRTDLKRPPQTKIPEVQRPFTCKVAINTDRHVYSACLTQRLTHPAVTSVPLWKMQVWKPLDT
ncbi:Nucleic-acid-binding protein from transposon X-element [Eumeta japonica]|uniref:Nucleic-acid-binding protein from transposon X-element n=1 Tax=Eumeta variegata TaxID=151549 RepID=A0A4C1SEN7_EUMVA|nr:Nucleic-acid-binding protein from transposon X-element [Eumeta japonica]